MKKISLCLIVTMMCLTSAALGFYGGSNMGYYPSFNKYLGYNASHSDVERYVKDAKSYIQACDNDIRSIQREKGYAIDEANNAVNSYNRRN